MKAPINFAHKIKGYKFNANGIEYSLGDSMGLDNEVWIYPQTPNHRNVINICFDWKKENYVVNIARTGDGTNFHTTLKAFAFVRRDYFTSFGNFIYWLETNLVRSWEKHFEF